MSVSPAEVQQLIQQGWSPDQIVDGLSHTEPDSQSDIQAAQKQGYNSSQILDGLVSTSQTQSESWVNKAIDFAKAPLYGLSESLGGAAATEGTLGQNSAASAEQGASDAAKAAIGSYDPAGPHVSVTDPSSWSYIPRSVAESAPDIGGALGVGSLAGAAANVLAPEVTIPAELLGTGAYWLNRYLGKNAQARAAAAGHSVQSGDVAGALPGTLAQAALNTVGNRVLANNALLKPVPVTGAGAGAVGQTLANIGKVAAVNAGTNAGSTAAGDIASDSPINPTDIANSAFLGGTTAGLLKAIPSVPEAIQSAQLSKYNAEPATLVANDLNSDRIAGDPNNPDDNSRMLSDASSKYNADIRQNLSDIEAQAKSLDNQGIGGSALRNIGDQATNYHGSLKYGVLDPSQAANIQSDIAPSAPDLATNLLKLNELNRLKSQVGMAASGASQSPTMYDKLRAAHLLSHYMPWAAGGSIAAAAMHNPVWLGVTAAPFALAAARAMGRAVTGSGDPVGTFVDRFGNSQMPPMGGLTPPPQAPADPTRPAPPPQEPGPLAPRAPTPGPPPQLALQPPSGPVRGDGFTMSPSAGEQMGAMRAMMAAQGTRQTPQEPVAPQGTDIGTQALARAAARVQAPKGTPNGNSESRGAHSASGEHADHTRPGIVHIKTSHLTRAQALAEIRRSPEAIAGGIEKRAGTRASIAHATHALKLSKSAKEILPQHTARLISESNGVTTRGEGAKVLGNFLDNFSGNDREVLENHFQNAIAHSGMTFLDSWKYKNNTEKAAGLARALAAAQARSTRTQTQ